MIIHSTNINSENVSEKKLEESIVEFLKILNPKVDIESIDSIKDTLFLLIKDKKGFGKINEISYENEEISKYISENYLNIFVNLIFFSNGKIIIELFRKYILYISNIFECEKRMLNMLNARYDNFDIKSQDIEYIKTTLNKYFKLVNENKLSKRELKEFRELLKLIMMINNKDSILVKIFRETFIYYENVSEKKLEESIVEFLKILNPKVDLASIDSIKHTLYLLITTKEGFGGIDKITYANKEIIIYINKNFRDIFVNLMVISNGKIIVEIFREYILYIWNIFQCENKILDMLNARYKNFDMKSQDIEYIKTTLNKYMTLVNENKLTEREFEELKELLRLIMQINNKDSVLVKIFREVYEKFI